MKLDITDRKLLNLLQEDGKQPIKELAAQLNLTLGPVHERVKKLERAGIIDKYVALIDPNKVKRGLVMYCTVNVKHSSDALKDFENAVLDMDEVMECSMIAGSFDFLMKVIVSDIEEFQHFITDKLSSLELVNNVHSYTVMKQVKYSTAIRIDEES